MAASVVAGPFAGLDGGTTTVPSAAAGEAVEQVEERKVVTLAFFSAGKFQRDASVEGFPDKGNSPVLYCGGKCLWFEFREPGGAEKGFRVIYHEEVVEDENRPYFPVLPTDGGSTRMVSVDGELRLNFEKSSMPMGGGDYRFDKLLLDAYNEANPDARVSLSGSCPGG